MKAPSPFRMILFLVVLFVITWGAWALGDFSFNRGAHTDERQLQNIAICWFIGLLFEVMILILVELAWKGSLVLESKMTGKQLPHHKSLSRTNLLIFSIFSL